MAGLDWDDMEAAGRPYVVGRVAWGQMSGTVWELDLRGADEPGSGGLLINWSCHRI